jgi:peptide/nickel transport system permease protein
MLVRVLRRITQSAALLFAIATMWFISLSLAPGDYFDEARLNPAASPGTIEKLRVAYGLAQPLPIRYGRWLWSLAHGDLGESIAYHQPVAVLLPPRCANTLLLTATSLLFSWSLALSFGTWAGANQGGLVDWTVRALAAILLAIPELIAATLLVYWAAHSGTFPVGGKGNSFATLASHMALPVLVLTAGAFPMLFRHVRLAVSETLASPYIRSALSFGIAPARLWLRYILPAAANPLLSLFGLSLAALLSGSLLVEVVFGWPGLGPLFLDALSARDTYLLLAPVILSSCFLLAGNIAADLLLLWNDPRIAKDGQ